MGICSRPQPLQSLEDFFVRSHIIGDGERARRFADAYEFAKRRHIRSRLWFDDQINK